MDKSKTGKDSAYIGLASEWRPKNPRRSRPRGKRNGASSADNPFLTNREVLRNRLVEDIVGRLLHFDKRVDSHAAEKFIELLEMDIVSVSEGAPPHPDQMLEILELTFKDMTDGAIKKKMGLLKKKSVNDAIADAIDDAVDDSDVDDVGDAIDDAINGSDVDDVGDVIDDVIDDSNVDDVSDVINDAIADPINDAIADPVNDVITDPVNDVIADPVNDAIADPVNDAIADPVNDDIADPVNDAIDDSITDYITDEKICNQLKIKINIILSRHIKKNENIRKILMILCRSILDENMSDKFTMISGILINGDISKKIKVNTQTLSKHLSNLRSDGILENQEKGDSSNSGFQKVRMRRDVLRFIVSASPLLKKFISEKKINFDY